MVHQEQTLGQLATSIPGATAIFHRHKLDFCCKGQQSLAQAAAQKGLDLAELMAQLNALAPTARTSPDWRKANPAELAHFILERYHARHRQQLPELIRLARRVETVHGDHPACPHGLAEHLQAMQQELESHMLKEEQILFPMLCNGFYPTGPIHVMQHEHVQHGDALAELEQLSHQMQAPAGACTTWNALYLGIKELKEDLMEHILLENEILFVEPTSQRGQCCGSCQ